MTKENCSQEGYPFNQIIHIKVISLMLYLLKCVLANCEQFYDLILVIRISLLPKWAILVMRSESDL